MVSDPSLHQSLLPPLRGDLVYVIAPLYPCLVDDLEELVGVVRRSLVFLQLFENIAAVHRVEENVGELGGPLYVTYPQGVHI